MTPLLSRIGDVAVAFVPIAGGAVALIDAEDLPKVAGRRWSMHPGGYARTTVRRGGRDTTLYLHQAIYGPVPSGMTVDHVNRVKLDCRRTNLRAASRAEQQANRAAQRNNQTGWKGVTWYPRLGKWRATIHVHGRARHLGLFATAEEAARAYDRAARAAFGDFCHLNFPDEEAAA